jgi:hypothetical protein
MVIVIAGWRYEQYPRQALKKVPGTMADPLRRILITGTRTR